MDRNMGFIFSYTSSSTMHMSGMVLFSNKLNNNTYNIKSTTTLTLRGKVRVSAESAVNLD